MLRALVIQNDKGKIRDIQDVVKIARALGQQGFKTHEHVLVKKILGPYQDLGGAFVVVVEGPSRTGEAGVSLGRNKMKNE